MGGRAQGNVRSLGGREGADVREGESAGELRTGKEGEWETQK